MKEYKQAILIGAAALGSEEKQLLSLLTWAGYGKKEATCTSDCRTCHGGCAKREIKKNVYVIAVDGGLKILLKHYMKPDFFVGDLDSFAYDETVTKETLQEWMKVIPHEIVPVQKDDTDMALAVKKAVAEGYHDISIYGGLGGTRVSHTFANVQLMSYYAKKDCRIQMVGDGIRMEILCNETREFARNFKGSVSVICLSEKAKGVSIQGLKYEYEGDLTNDVALGVSNSFVGKDATVSVKDGTLLLIYEKEE